MIRFTEAAGPPVLHSGESAMRKTLFCFIVLTSFVFGAPQAAPPARTFATQCTICHGGDAGGTDRAPSILSYVSSHSDQELVAFVRGGRPEKGMPAFNWNDLELKVLAENLRGLTAGVARPPAGLGRGGRGVPVF